MSLSERDKQYLEYLTKHLREDDPSFGRKFEPPPGNISQHLPTAAIIGMVVGLIFGLWNMTCGGGIIIGIMAMIVAVVYMVIRDENRQPGSKK